MSTSPDRCPPTDPADTSTAAGWLGYLAAHQGDVALVVDDSRGGRVEYRADAPAPAASAAKVLHLAAYADALDAGRLSPDQPVVIRDWEAWFLPGLDGGAHGRALQAIWVANDGVQASYPGGTVRLDEVVTALIEFSDNAAADFLRELLGDAALVAAGVSASASGIEVPSYLGAAIALLLPADAPPPGASREERAAAELALALRYASDPGYRAEVLAVPAPAVDAQLEWADNTSTTTALALAAVHQSIYSGAEDPANLGAVNARKQLEWPTAPPDTLGLGAKGGSYPGVIAEAMTLRRSDGSRATGVLLVQRMPAADWDTGLTSFAHQELLLAAMSDPAVLDRLSCSVGAGSTIPG
jgi:beta-lactamase class A